MKIEIDRERVRNATFKAGEQMSRCSAFFFLRWEFHFYILYE